MIRPETQSTNPLQERFGARSVFSQARVIRTAGLGSLSVGHAAGSYGAPAR